MEKIYLDVCTLCRPFDDQSIMRIRLETDAYFLILKAIYNKKYEMIVSPVHYKEISSIEDHHERIESITLLNKYGKKPSLQLKEIRKRAETLYPLKFGAADAAHIAFAEKTSKYFITSDDKLRKKANKMKLYLSTMNPIEFCAKEDLK